MNASANLITQILENPQVLFSAEFWAYLYALPVAAVAVHLLYLGIGGPLFSFWLKRASRPRASKKPATAGGKTRRETRQSRKKAATIESPQKTPSSNRRGKKPEAKGSSRESEAGPATTEVPVAELVAQPLEGIPEALPAEPVPPRSLPPEKAKDSSEKAEADQPEVHQNTAGTTTEKNTNINGQGDKGKNGPTGKADPTGTAGPESKPEPETAPLKLPSRQLKLASEREKPVETLFTRNERTRREREFQDYWREIFNNQFQADLLLRSGENISWRQEDPAYFPVPANLLFRESMVQKNNEDREKSLKGIRPLAESLLESYGLYGGRTRYLPFLFSWMIWSRDWKGAGQLARRVLSHFPEAEKDLWQASPPTGYEAPAYQVETVRLCYQVLALLSLLAPDQVSREQGLRHFFFVRSDFSPRARFVFYFNLREQKGLEELAAGFYPEFRHLKREDGAPEFSRRDQLVLFFHGWRWLQERQLPLHELAVGGKENSPENENNMDAKGDGDGGQSWRHFCRGFLDEVRAFWPAWREQLGYRQHIHLAMAFYGWQKPLWSSTALMAAGRKAAAGGEGDFPEFLPRLLRQLLLFQLQFENGRYRAAWDTAQRLNEKGWLEWEGHPYFPETFLSRDTFLACLRISALSLGKPVWRQSSFQPGEKNPGRIQEQLFEEKILFLGEMILGLNQHRDPRPDPALERGMDLMELNLQPGRFLLFENGFYRLRQNLIVHILVPWMDYARRTDSWSRARARFPREGLRALPWRIAREALAYALELDGQREKALFYYNQLGRRSEEHFVGSRRAGIMLELNLFQEAEGLLRRLVEKYGRRDPGLVNQLAIMLSRTGRYLEAEKFFAYLVRHYPDRRSYRLNRALNAEKLARHRVGELWASVG